MTTSTAEATPTQTAVRFLASDAAAVTGQTIDADGGWATTASSIFSRPVATNLTVGTVAYAAPEQLMGLEIDERAEQCAPAAEAFHLIRLAAESAFEPGCSLPRRSCARFDTGQV
jgi:serine/threonine protein kinase